MDESDHQISFHNLKKFMTSLSVVIGALGSLLEPHLKSDLPTDLYSGSTPIASIDESDHQISFNLLNKSVISPSATIGSSGSPLGPHPKRDLAKDLHSGFTPIAIKDKSNRRIRYRRLQKINNITTRGDQGIGLCSRNPFKNRSPYISILWLCPSSPL
jgi:hypothetical protein